MSFFPDIQPLIREIQEFENAQNQKQDQIIALLKETNQLLTQILTKNEENIRTKSK